MTQPGAEREGLERLRKALEKHVKFLQGRERQTDLDYYAGELRTIIKPHLAALSGEREQAGEALPKPENMKWLLDAANQVIAELSKKEDLDSDTFRWLCNAVGQVERDLKRAALSGLAASASVHPAAGPNENCPVCGDQMLLGSRRWLHSKTGNAKCSAPAAPAEEPAAPHAKGDWPGGSEPFPNEAERELIGASAAPEKLSVGGTLGLDGDTKREELVCRRHDVYYDPENKHCVICELRGTAKSTEPDHKRIEAFRVALMDRFSNIASMEVIATCAYMLAADSKTAPEHIADRETALRQKLEALRVRLGTKWREEAECDDGFHICSDAGKDDCAAELDGALAQLLAETATLSLKEGK